VKDLAKHVARVAVLWAVSCGLLLLMPRAWWPVVSHGAGVTVALSIVAMVALLVRQERREKPLDAMVAETTVLLERLRNGRREYLVAMVEIRDKEVALAALAHKAGRHDESQLHEAEVHAIDEYLAMAHGVAVGAAGDA
jgi:hypothetical protein